MICDWCDNEIVGSALETETGIFCDKECQEAYQELFSDDEEEDSIEGEEEEEEEEEEVE